MTEPMRDICGLPGQDAPESVRTGNDKKRCILRIANIKMGSQ